MIQKYEKDNKTVRGHLLNHMINNLFDLFVSYKSAKTIWDSLEKKYGADDAGKRKYVVSRWLAFKMEDDKPIMEQVHLYENLCTDVLNEGMKMCDIFQANVLLEKFPPSWAEYRNHLKHKKKDLNLQDLIGYMRTEEANRLKDKLDSISSISAKANLVETGGPSHNTRFKGKGINRQNKNQHKIPKPEGKINKKVVCYVYEVPSHKVFQCSKRQSSGHNNQKKGSSSGVAQASIAEHEDVIAAVVVEANLVDNKIDWILDTGASRHPCANKELFRDFEDATDGECVFMGNSSTTGVLGKGKIML
ncbi:unnamed protein product, partial [Cuscuta epithymum]